MDKKYNLLLPIAGRAQRFLDKGYTMPKPLIMSKDKHIIDWSMESVDTSECNIIFAVRLEHINNFSIDHILKEKFGSDIKIVVIVGLHLPFHNHLIKVTLFETSTFHL